MPGGFEVFRVTDRDAQIVQQLREKLGHNAAALQIPIGLEDVHKGVVDVISMKSITFSNEDR